MWNCRKETSECREPEKRNTDTVKYVSLSQISTDGALETSFITGEEIFISYF